MPKLVLIEGLGGKLPHPPYPPTVIARGWRFELDMPRVLQSTSWLTCPPEIRGQLLQLWAMSWLCYPCGSLVNDDDALAGLIGMPVAWFRSYAEVLLRGWYMAADGRLYHPVVTECVERMLAHRFGEAEKKARQRATTKAQKDTDTRTDDPPRATGQYALKDQQVTGAAVTMSPGTPTGVLGESVTGTGTGEKIGSEANASERADPAAPARPAVAPQPDENDDDQAEPQQVKGFPPCPIRQLVELYHEVLPMGAKVLTIDPERERHLRARWRQYGTMRGYASRSTGLAEWRRLFAYAATSPFLMGRTQPQRGRLPFELTLDFLVRPSRFRDLVEGKYHRT